MLLLETNLTLSHVNGILISNGMRIRCGILKGDSLSPLLFCMALIPLSQLLNSTGYGYKIMEKKINHLFYMDDLKLYAQNDDELVPVSSPRDLEVPGWRPAGAGLSYG